MTPSIPTDHGLVIGKFNPPHQGHHLLIRTAAAVSRRVSVIVMARNDDAIPLGNRVAWLEATHAGEPNVAIVSTTDELPVDFTNDRCWQAHVAVMREALATLGAPPVTAVFSSEDYGPELARRFGAMHVAVDPERRLVPVSGSAIRGDLASGWAFLAASTRAGLAFRVVVLGGGSTGTTTLARDLTDHWRSRGGAHALTRYVPEYGRDYSVAKIAQAGAEAQLIGAKPPEPSDLDWASAEFEHVARRQLALEDAEAVAGGPVLICDTDAFATTVWHERYVGGRNPEVERIAESRSHNLYLLTDPSDVPHEQDGVREAEDLRAWMTQRFIARLTETGRRFTLVRGDRATRLRSAAAAADEAISARLL